MALVSIRNVNKVYDGGVHAVKDVSLEIRDKEFVVFVGPSGCGKTTTLRMVAGLESITSGDIAIDDTVVNLLPPMDRDIAMVFQNYALYPHMSVYKNMAFGLKMRKFDAADIDKRVKHAAGILGIENLLDRKPRQLSGGQRQRVALGRAIVRDPKVFLFDEPLSNLDAKLRVQMRVELKKLHERLGTTAIYVTHDQVEAMTLGDRVVVMKDGVVQQMGEPLELYNTPANRFVAGFIGSPAMNFADVTLAQSGGKLWAEAPGLRIALPEPIARRANGHSGNKATLGVRPERGGRAARFGDRARHPGRQRRLRGVSRAHDQGPPARQAETHAQSRPAAPVRRPERARDLTARGGHFGPDQPSSTSHLALRCTSRGFLKS
jgi:multiple sugar transport system ATP-binding protein